MAGLHAADGSLNVTVVSGTSLTGLYAADGSINVVVTDGSSYVGAYAPCGAWNVFLVTSGIKGYYAPNGAMNVTQTPYLVSGAVRVTVLSGSLSGTVGSPYGLLLALTRAS